MAIKKSLIFLVFVFSIVSCSFNLGRDGVKGKDGASAVPKKATDSSTIKK